MQIELQRVQETGEMVVSIIAETYAEILLMGRWQGHVEAAGQRCSSRIIETTPASDAAVPRASVILTVPIADRRPAEPDGPGGYTQAAPKPGGL